MNITFIRHGKTKGNLEKRYIGRTNEKLLETEKKILSEKKYPFAQHVYTSTMKRCIETAAIIYPNLSCSIEEGLKETDFGMFEYKNYEELKNESLYEKWLCSGGSLGFPEGESLENFKKRCIQTFRKCVADGIVHKYTDIAFVVHGGTIMAILEEYSEPHRDYYDWQVSNGMGYTGKWNQEKKQIEYLGKF